MSVRSPELHLSLKDFPSHVGSKDLLCRPLSREKGGKLTASFLVSVLLRRQTDFERRFRLTALKSGVATRRGRNRAHRKRNMF